MDRSEISLLIWNVLSRCFDVIDHGMLLSELELLCISTGWFRSYLSDHEKRVRMGNCPNRFRSRLAAFRVHAWDRFYIYNIASNDLSRYIPREINGFHITTVRYADDTQLAITGPRNRLAEMELCLEQVLNTL